MKENDEIYCCRPLGDLFSSLRRVKCVLAFFFFLCCYLNAWTENDTLPTTVLKKKSHAICCPEQGTYWYVCKNIHALKLSSFNTCIICQHICMSFCEMTSCVSAHIRVCTAVLFHTGSKQTKTYDRGGFPLLFFRGNTVNSTPVFSYRHLKTPNV